MIQFILNNKTIQSTQNAGSTVLDFVRYQQHLSGTKIGCREGDCGACTVLVGEWKDEQMHYRSMTSCLMPLSNANGKHIVTVEGLNMDQLSPIQQAIIEEGGTQCGFCTVGFVVSLSGFAMGKSPANKQNGIAAIDGNICRCTGYKSLERAAHQIVQLLKDKDTTQPLQWLIDQQFIPAYFGSIPEKLKSIHAKMNTTSEVSDATIVGGGTDLWVQRPETMNESAIHPLFDQTGLKQLYQKDRVCYIGGANTATDLLESPILQQHFPGLSDHMKLVSSTPIRNMGTLAGNLVNASPIGDLTIFFLALDASVQLDNQGQKRVLKLRQFYRGYKTIDKQANEIVANLFFDLPETDDYFNFEKVCKRTHLDIASVNSACSIRVKNQIIERAHLSAGGVGPTPKYLTESAKALIGEKIHPELLQKVAQIIQEEISPISDARGTADYKRLLLRQLFYAHFLKGFPELVTLDQLVSPQL